MSRTAYPLRLPEDLRERMQEAADADDRSLHSHIIRTLERAHPDADDGGGRPRAPVPKPLRRERPKAAPVEAALVECGLCHARDGKHAADCPRHPNAMDAPTYNCPTSGCEFTAASPKAVCPDHGRTVKLA